MLPSHARSSAMETLWPIRSLAGYTIDTLESSFRKGQALGGKQEGDSMRNFSRRGVIGLGGGATAAWTLKARAQQPNRHIGMLIGYAENDAEIQARLAAFRQALEGNGWK